ncbi:hypothetical protein L1987_37312 [Smallanthus sonchifolius]|uniref:Uncharacterized protein n=1 Tax=Smallanthus sonchifolius TaxID=185202 RepID=A0ACB9HFL0_9ASTR|nr:hypothetical protein L1987_37312 [Smallanthus sonchifolius]
MLHSKRRVSILDKSFIISFTHFALEKAEEKGKAKRRGEYKKRRQKAGDMIMRNQTGSLSLRMEPEEEEIKNMKKEGSLSLWRERDWEGDITRPDDSTWQPGIG